MAWSSYPKVVEETASWCSKLVFQDVHRRNEDISGWWWLEPWNFMTFHSVGNFIIPADELIFFRGVETTNQTYTEHPYEQPTMIAILI